MSTSDRVLPATRVLAVVIVPFLVAAFVICYLLPTRTQELFAWGIKPPITAMLLASVYLGGAVFFVLVARASRWSEVAPGFPPVALFASLLGVTTVLHWDRFTPGHISFIAWAALYFVTPFLVIAAAYANTRATRGAPVDEAKVPFAVRAVLGATGIGELGVAAVLFAAPEWLAESWPWAVTPLTARTLAAVYALGLANVLIALDGRWQRVRIPLVVQAVMLALISVAILVRRGDFDAGPSLGYGFAALVLAVLAVVLAGLFAGGRRDRVGVLSTPPA